MREGHHYSTLFFELLFSINVVQLYRFSQQGVDMSFLFVHVGLFVFDLYSFCDYCFLTTARATMIPHQNA